MEYLVYRAPVFFTDPSGNDSLMFPFVTRWRWPPVVSLTPILTPSCPGALLTYLSSVAISPFLKLFN